VNGESGDLICEPYSYLITVAVGRANIPLNNDVTREPHNQPPIEKAAWPQLILNSDVTRYLFRICNFISVLGRLSPCRS